MQKSISIESIAIRILEIRGKKVILDNDLALIYNVKTKRLNEQVKRNLKRFPRDFMFQLTFKEKQEVVANCDHLKILKFSPQLPYAFTEQGVAMLSSVLNSDRAIQVNILIMRVFVKIKEILLTHKDLTRKVEILESQYTDHDYKIKIIFETIKKLLEPPPVSEKPKIGFHPNK